MADDYKPFILRKFAHLSRHESDEELERLDAHAKEEGRSSSEVFRIAMMRRNFADLGKGDFYDEMLVESRKKGEDHMAFIERMNADYLTH